MKLSICVILVFGWAHSCSREESANELFEAQTLNHSVLKIISDPLCGPKNKSVTVARKDKVDGLDCSIQRYISKKDKNCPGYRSHQVHSKKIYCSESTEPFIKCEGFFKIVDRFTNTYCNGKSLENQRRERYCERQEFIPTCTKNQDGQFWGVESYACKIPPKSTYPECKAYKSASELNEYLTHLEQQIPINLYLLIDEKAKILIKTKEKEKLRCLITDLEGKALSEDKLNQLKESYMAIFKETYTPAITCDQLSRKEEPVNSKVMTSLVAWFHFHQEELKLIQSNLANLRNSSFDERLKVLENELEAGNGGSK